VDDNDKDEDEDERGSDSFLYEFFASSMSAFS
jgi:hypothetical protein